MASTSSYDRKYIGSRLFLIASTTAAIPAGAWSAVGQCEQAARRQCITVPAQDTEGIFLIRHEVEHGDHQQAKRLAEVEEPLHGGRAEHRHRLAEVGSDHGGVLVALENELAVSHGHLVVVHLDHAARRVGRLCDLVHVADGGDA